ncbi:ROK family protein [Mariniphaga sediminis]|nr:ROK family protein [Mariniphaga sediminis]
MKSYLSIDAGGTFLKSAILSSQGEVFKESVFLTESFSESSKEQIFRAFRNVMDNALSFVATNKMELSGVGVAFPGPFDIEKATPLMQHKFQNLYGINLRDVFSSMPGFPSNIPIKFVHDANAVLIGELWKGNAQGYSNAAVITLGTGLGFAISEEGTVLQNKIGGPYLSIFQLPYREGILEDYASKRGFIRIYQQLTSKISCNGIKVSDIGEWAANGDRNSLLTFLKVGEILGDSLKNILNERKIECLLFGGQISKSFHFMEEGLRTKLKNTTCLQKIDVVKNIDYAAFWGAVSNVLQND